jgi:hypothetical protein
VLSLAYCPLSKHLSLSITQIKEGRQYILDKSRGIFLALLPHLDNKHIIRRRGILGMIRYSQSTPQVINITLSQLTFKHHFYFFITIECVILFFVFARNCLFEFDYHKWLLSDEVDLLTHLLLPIRGHDVFSDDVSFLWLPLSLSLSFSFLMLM